MSRLNDLLDLSHVPRWTTHPVTRPQSVAEHSFRVTVIAREITILMSRPELMLEVAEWALDHDGPEAKLGDMPAPVHDMIKFQFGADAVNDLEDTACPWYTRPKSTLVRQIVRVADVIEALSWVTIYGNALNDKFDGQNIGAKLSSRLDKMLDTYDPAIKPAAILILKGVKLWR